MLAGKLWMKFWRLVLLGAAFHQDKSDACVVYFGWTKPWFVLAAFFPKMHYTEEHMQKKKRTSLSATYKCQI